MGESQIPSLKPSHIQKVQVPMGPLRTRTEQRFTSFRLSKGKKKKGRKDSGLNDKGFNFEILKSLI